MSAAPMLTVQREGQMVLEQELGNVIHIGRSDENTIQLDDQAISREHAIVRSNGEHFEIEKKSRFGQVIVNGAEVDRAEITPGDVILIGPYLVRVKPGEPEVVELPQAASPVPPTASVPEPVLGETVVLSSDLLEESPPASADPEESLMPLDVGGGESHGGAIEGSGVNAEVDAAADAGEWSPDQDQPVEMPFGSMESDSGSSSDSSPDYSPDELGLSIEGAASKESGDDSSSGGAFDFPGQEAGDATSALGIGQEDQGFSSDFADEDSEGGHTKITPVSGITVKLIFPPGAADINEFEVDQDEISLGRGKSCDITLHDKKASRKHIIIRRAGLNFTIKDLESANGTFVNGLRVEEQDLNSEDKIRIGDTEFEFRAVSSNYQSHEQDFLQVDEPEQYEEPLSNGGGGQELQAYQLPQIAGAPVGDFGTPGSISQEGTQEIAKPSGPLGKFKVWFNKYPPAQRRKFFIYAVVLLFLWDTMFEDQQPKKRRAPVRNKAQAGKLTKTFQTLSAKDKRFVQNQHALSFEAYKKRDYDKALFEIRKIFELVDDYKDSREIERYALEGKERLEAKLSESKRKEEEAKFKARISELTTTAQELMVAEKFEEAIILFPQILALDPENQLVRKWQKEIDRNKRDEELRAEEERLRLDLDANAQKLVDAGMEKISEKAFRRAIAIFRDALKSGSTHEEILETARNGVEQAKQGIQREIEPVLNEAKTAESEGVFDTAYKLFEKADEIDPDNPQGKNGMDRVRGILHQRAKVLYTEAVIAENYSDFTVAKSGFEKIIKTTPKDDSYYQSSIRKLARYQRLIEFVDSAEAGELADGGESGDRSLASDSEDDGFGPDPFADTVGEGALE